MALALVVMGVVAAAGQLGFDLMPDVKNPFPTETVDRSQPTLLKSLEDLNLYHAATANSQVVVDTEKDTKHVPAIIRGERTVFTAAGSVDATVDFSALDDRSIAVSPDRLSATITLPAPNLTAPRVDPKQSRVVSRERGLLDRIGSIFSDTPTSDRPYFVAAEQKMAAAALGSDLRARAETNTRIMLENMLPTLGYTSVTVTFAPAPAVASRVRVRVRPAAVGELLSVAGIRRPSRGLTGRAYPVKILAPGRLPASATTSRDSLYAYP
ncbi:MAG: DUF4230 domain-containing protein [Acidimicrobiales bacterium]